MKPQLQGISKVKSPAWQWCPGAEDMFHKDVSGDYVGRRVDVGCAQKHLASMSLG